MGISIDYNKIESLYTLSQALDVLKDPKALQETLATLRTAVDEQRALNLARDKMDNADAYVKKAKDEIQTLDDKLDVRVAEVEKSEANLKTTKEQAEAEYNKQNAISALKTEEANALFAAAETEKEISNKLLKDLLGQKEKLNAWEADLALKEAELADKAEKLKALLAE